MWAALGSKYMVAQADSLPLAEPYFRTEIWQCFFYSVLILENILVADARPADCI